MFIFQNYTNRNERHLAAVSVLPQLYFWLEKHACDF